MHPRLAVRDAVQLVPHAQAVHLVTVCKWQMEHISDLVRLLAIAASPCGGWFIDVDLVWQKPRPGSPTASGH
eukprot:11196231-Lingulodinium_polyedra.AAC.1